MTLTPPQKRSTERGPTSSELHVEPTPPLRNRYDISKAEISVFLIAAILTVVSRSGLIFAHHYSSDDYPFVLGGTSDDILFNQTLSQARPLEYVLLWLFAKLGIKFAELSAVVTAAHSLILVVGALILVRVLRCSLSYGALLSFVLIFALHPFQSEQPTIQAFLWDIDIAMTLTFFGLWACNQGGWRGHGIAIAAFVAAFLMFQTGFNYIATALCFMVVFSYAENLTRPVPARWGTIAADRRIWTMVLCTVCAIAISAVINIVVMHAFRIPTTPRGVLLGWGDIAHRWMEFRINFLEDNVLFSRTLRLIFVGLALASILALAVRGRVWISFDRFVQLVTIAVALIAGIVAVYCIVLAGNVWWPVPRTLVGFSVWCAGVMALAYQTFPRRLRAGLSALAVAVTFIFICNNSEVGVDQTRINMRDQLMAGRIIGRLEQAPDFKPDMPTAVVGNDYGINQFHIRTSQGNLNTTAFATDWSKQNLLREISGYPLPYATPAQEVVAAAYCKEHKPWPAFEAAVIIRQLAIVCLAY